MERVKNRYIFSEFAVNFLFGFLLLSVLFSLEGFVRILDVLAKGSFDPVLLVFFFGISVVLTFTYVIPLAFLSATTSLTARMAADRELDVFLSSGVRLQTLVMRLCMLAVACTIALAYFNMVAFPRAKYRQRMIIRTMKFGDPLGLLQPRTVVKEIPGATIYAERIGADHTLENVVISSTDPDGRVIFLRASRGSVSFGRETRSLVFLLRDGLLIVHRPGKKEELSRMRFDAYDFALPLPEDYRKDDRLRVPEMTLTEMRRAGIEIQEYVEVNRRLVFALAPLLFLFFGAGIGMRMKQQGRSVHLGLGALTTLAFFELMTLGEIMALKTGAAAWLWLPAVVFAASGIRLWWKQ